MSVYAKIGHMSGKEMATFMTGVPGTTIAKTASFYAYNTRGKTATSKCKNDKNGRFSKL